MEQGTDPAATWDGKRACNRQHQMGIIFGFYTMFCSIFDFRDGFPAGGVFKR